MSLVTGLFFLVLLLNQRWSPPLGLQVSHCSIFRIMCDVPSIAVFCSELNSYHYIRHTLSPSFTIWPFTQTQGLPCKTVQHLMIQTISSNTIKHTWNLTHCQNKQQQSMAGIPSHKMVCVRWQVGPFKTFSCTIFTSHNSESKDYKLFNFWTLLQHRSLNDETAIKQQTSQKTSSRDVWILWLSCEAKLLGCVILCLFFISTEVFVSFPVTRQNWRAHVYIERNGYGGEVVWCH